MDNERRGHLLLVLDHLLDTHGEWVESDTPYVTESMEKAIDDAVEVFATGAIPADCRDLTSVMGSLSDRWTEYRNQAAMKGDPAFLPDNAFWKLFDRLRDLRETARPKVRQSLESIEELTKQHVTDRQICLIYGWMDASGQPEAWKLREERAKPGTHTGKDFVPPLEKRRIDEEERRKKIVAGIQEAQQRKLDRLAAPPPDSLEKLVAEGVSARQVAKMLNCSVEDVYRRCKELKIVPPPESYDLDAGPASVNSKQVKKQPASVPIGRPSIQQQIQEAEVIGETLAEDDDDSTDQSPVGDEESAADTAAVDVEGQVISLSEQGFELDAICNAMGMGRRKVWKILRDHKKAVGEAAIST